MRMPLPQQRKQNAPLASAANETTYPNLAILFFTDSRCVKCPGILGLRWWYRMEHPDIEGKIAWSVVEFQVEIVLPGNVLRIRSYIAPISWTVLAFWLGHRTSHLTPPAFGAPFCWGAFLFQKVQKVALLQSALACLQYSSRAGHLHFLAPNRTLM